MLSEAILAAALRECNRSAKKLCPAATIAVRLRSAQIFSTNDSSFESLIEPIGLLWTLQLFLASWFLWRRGWVIDKT